MSEEPRTAATDRFLIVKADARMRRQALAMVVGGAVIGTAILGWGLPWLEQRVNDAVRSGAYHVSRMACLAAGGLIAVLGAGVIASGLNMVGIGTRVVRSGRFPPEGMRVLRDTRVVTGRGARALGHVQRALGVLLIACAAVLLGLSGYVLVVLWP